MDRSKIEKSVSDSFNRIPGLIEAQPHRACLICFFLGMFFMAMPRLFMSLFVVAAAVTVAAWFLADDSRKKGEGDEISGN